MDTYDKITCRECGKSYVTITPHLKMHALSKEQYTEKYPNAPLNSQKRIDQINSSAKKGSKAKLELLASNPEARKKQAEIAKKVGSDWAEKCRANPELAEKRNTAWFAGRDKYFEENPDKYKEFGLLGLQAQDRAFTKCEAVMASILDRLEIEYKVKSKVGYYEVDFLIPSCGLAIEVQGDYWHGNPSMYESQKLNEAQKANIARDKRKKSYLESFDWKVVAIWEDDLLFREEYSFNIIKEEINNVLSN